MGKPVEEYIAQEVQDHYDETTVVLIFLDLEDGTQMKMYLCKHYDGKYTLDDTHHAIDRNRMERDALDEMVRSGIKVFIENNEYTWGSKGRFRRALAANEYRLEAFYTVTKSVSVSKAMTLPPVFEVQTDIDFD